jgi:hypothetical protein
MQESGVGWDELAVEASPGGRFGFAVRRTTGGRDQDHGLEAWGLRFGLPFPAGWIGLCVFGGFELNDFSFEDRFEMDRGDADYMTRDVGLQVAFPLGAWKGAGLRAWVAPAVSVLKYEVSGRTLMVDGEVSVQERNLGATRWEVAGQAGLSVRWRFIGVAGGVMKRPALTSGTLAFIRMGLAVIPNRRHPPAPAVKSS